MIVHVLNTEGKRSEIKMNLKENWKNILLGKIIEAIVWE